MRLKPSTIIAIGAVLLGSPGLATASQPAAAGTVNVRLVAADEAEATDAPAAVEVPTEVDPEADYDLAESYEEFVGQGASYGAPYVSFEPVPYAPRTAVRFGWWGVDVDGSKSNVGEWQGLDSSSPFWDVDGLRSNGYQTVDFYATGPENETTQGGLHLYMGPRLTLDLEYDRYLHRLWHKPLGGTPDPFTPGDFPLEGGFYDPPLPANTPGFVNWGEDLNPGRDYALRVQQLQANFQGNLTSNLSWRLNVWGLKKEGMRQANSTQHCFRPATGANTPGDRTCHVLSQGQNIDWLTMEIEPVIEARFGWLTAEYSHTLRSFEQNDEIVTRSYVAAVGAYGFQTTGAYAYVPENITDIDRLKLAGELAPNTHMYVVGHVGNTHNEFRKSDRKFYGVDARLTNTSYDGLSLTVYGKTHTQENSADTTSLNARYPDQAGLWLENQPPQTIYNPDSLYLGLVDRDYLSAGVKGRWRPFHNSCDVRSGLAVVGGYEYSRINRDNVTYDLLNLQPFTQPDSVSNMFFVGLQQDWSQTLSSYLRYRMVDTDYPLLGVTHRHQLSLDAAINSNLPEHEDRIELGGNWSPTDNFLLNLSVWIQNSYHHSEYVNFDEDDYPIVLSAWYAPNEQWSFTGGFATFSNWIDQDITLGREDGIGANELIAFTAPWSYEGRADVFNLGAAYAATCRLTLTSGVEYVRSRNRFDEPPAPQGAIPYTDLPGYSAVRVNTWRFMGGADYELSQNMNTFLRYNYYDFDDQGWNYDSGTAHMFLAGLSGVY